MSKKESLFINEIRNVAKRVIPPGGHIWLYGSRARGEATAESDWDLLILLDKTKSEASDFDAIGYPLIEAGWDYAENVNPQIYSYAEWDARSITPYYVNVEHDKTLLA